MNSDWVITWADDFDRPTPGLRWAAGYLNTSPEAHLTLGGPGIEFSFAAGKDYASCGLVTRAAITGNFEARVHFEVTRPAAGATFELAAISIDPPRESQADAAQANPYALSRVYDVHGAPPYVSSEFDENDGWRIGWNRASASTVVGANGQPISDNHFNRYGQNTRPLDIAGPVRGWLALRRAGADWFSGGAQDDGAAWRETGSVRDMNLPDAVFLRLGAKHWPKAGGPSPAQCVRMLRFELWRPPERPVLAGLPAAPTAPPEVRLVEQVRACRACDYFHQDAPFGPVPYVRLTPSLVSSRRGEVTGLRAPEPQVLYGCRKAPIMQVGINPNLPEHFIFPGPASPPTAPTGAFRVREHHDTLADYAAAHRHAPAAGWMIDGPEEMEKLLRDDMSLILSARAGHVVAGDPAHDSFRAGVARQARLVLQYADGERAEQPVPASGQWGQDASFVVARQLFEAHEVVAGYMDDTSAKGKTVRLVRARPDGYYRRADEILQATAQRLKLPLRLGEDMSLHDAVACASPGWDVKKWGTPEADVKTQCLDRQRWLHQQIEQSDPAVMLVSGRMALTLITGLALTALCPSLDTLPDDTGGPDGLFATLARTRLLWPRVNNAGQTVETPVVLAPHFSYLENLVPQCYFSESAWAQFDASYPHVTRWIEQQSADRPRGPMLRKIQGPPVASIVLLTADSPFWKDLRTMSPAAEDELRRRWVDPIAEVSAALARELALQDYGQPNDRGQVRRTAGPCAYCRNPSWVIDGGCAYG